MTSPVNTIIHTTNIAIERVMSINDIMPFIIGCPTCPPDKGIIFPAPVIAAINTAKKLANDPYRASQKVTLSHLVDSSNLFHKRPRTIKNIPLIMPYR